MKIAIQGKDYAMRWMYETRELNAETEALLSDVSAALRSVREFSDGTIIDEIYDIGENLLGATNTMVNGMDRICDTVNGLVNKLSELFENVRSTLSGLKNSVG